MSLLSYYYKVFNIMANNRDGVFFISNGLYIEVLSGLIA